MNELAERGLAAIRAGNAEAYIELLGTNAAMNEYCPELLEKMGPKGIQEAHEFVRSQIEECGKMVDWSKAQEVSRIIPTEEIPEGSCKNHNSVYKIRDILFEFEVLGERFQIKLDDPVRFGPVYVLVDDPKCRKIRHE
jgi:hypothetical protein